MFSDLPAALFRRARFSREAADKLIIGLWPERETNMVPDIYERLEETMLREFDEADNNPVVNDVLNYTLPNSSEPTDYGLWEEGASYFLKDNHNMLQEWDRMTNDK